MSPGDHFSDLLERVRRGESAAARELVNRYESTIRVAVRIRLTDPRLRRQFDSMDVCQSVLASFFVHAAMGAYVLHEPSQLVALLTKMAQNKLNMRARAQFRLCRDVGRLSTAIVEETNVASSFPGPVQQVAGKELLDRALGMMTPEIRAIAVRRMHDEAWADIASALGGTADGRRKQFERAIGQIADGLEVDALER
jgi:RNA polymerase sigma-70 factor (ECF subfamily)